MLSYTNLQFILWMRERERERETKWWQKLRNTYLIKQNVIVK